MDESRSDGNLPPPNFQFVTTTISTPKMNAEHRYIIKSQAMREAGLARRKYWPNNTRHFSRILQSRKGTSSPPDDAVKANNMAWYRNQRAFYSLPDDDNWSLWPRVHSPSFQTSLVSDHIDPFTTFPIRCHGQVDMLVHHINDDTHASFKLFREYWFPLVMQDSAAFHCALSLAAQHRVALKRHLSQQEIQAMTDYGLSHYTAALISLNHKVADPVQSISDEMIMAVLMLACNPLASSRSKNYLQHMAGLATIINLRGGIETLDSNKKLRLLVFWVDTMGAAALGLQPAYPAPTQYLPGSPKSFPGQSRPSLSSVLAEAWVATFPTHLKLIKIFDDLFTLTTIVEAESLQKRAVQDPRFTGFYIIPLVHRLFSLRPTRSENPQERMIFDAAKLGAFLYLLRLRYFVARRYPCLKEPFFESAEESASTLTSICLRDLDAILTGHLFVWSALQPLKFWVLTVGAISANWMPGRFFHLEDLVGLASSTDSNDLTRSMGPLMNNSWTVSTCYPSTVSPCSTPSG